MAANRPTQIDMPPVPADPATPDVPNSRDTPTSTTTSMSELSTVAIKDGHRGHFPHHHNPKEAERADRISRLAGLERVAVTGRHPYGLAPASASNPPPGYFDASNQPQAARERSTVGSASATGSVGGRTTWASGSDQYDPDQDQEADTSSAGGFSEETASLVGFGEGARTPARQHSQIGSPAIGKASAAPTYLRDQLPGNSKSINPSTEQQTQDTSMLDGMTYDGDIVDTADRTPPLAGPGPGEATTSEQAIRERMSQRDAEQARSSCEDAMDVEPQQEN